MKLIILLTCLSIQRYMNFNFSLSQYDWFTPYQELLRKYVHAQFMDGIVGLFVIVLPLAFVAMFVGVILSGTWVTSFIYGLLVLFYCLDGRLQTKFLKDHLSGKEAAGSEADQQVSKVLGEPIPDNMHAKARATSDAIFFHAMHHVFGVIFWYLILGLFGAVMYFLVVFIANPSKVTKSALSPYVESAKAVQDILAWVPVRLVGLAYALAGATAKTISALMQNIVGPLSNEKKLPGVFGLTAIKADVENPNSASLEENKKALTMVLLGTGVWMAVILLLTIFRIA